MAGLRKKLSSQGITVAQFGFQFVVILLGVYLAVFFESKAEDRSRESDARGILVSLLRELELDEAEILEVRRRQVEITMASEALMDLLATASQAEDAAIDSLFEGPMSFNPTAFPRRAAYSALVASGNMGYLSDPDLVLQLADLYEHHFIRLVNHGDWSDKIANENFWPTVDAQYWDQARKQLMRRGEAANAGFWNLAFRRHRLHGNYVARIDQVLGELRAVKENLKEFLSE